MNTATGARETRPANHLPYAVIAAGTLVAIAIVVTALVAPGVHIVPNPQGGIWIERNNTLYLCQARPKAPAPCVNLADGSNLTYAELTR